jgi:hypothetical protein
MRAAATISAVLLAISGNTMVAGAPGEDSNATGANKVIKITRALGLWRCLRVYRLGNIRSEIGVEQSAGSIRIFWPLTAAGFVLDEANDLNASPIIG